MKLISVYGTLVALASAGCVVSPIDAEAPTAESVGSAEAEIEPAPPETVPAYFNYDNRYAVADDASYVYAHFDSYPGKILTARVHPQHGAPGASVGFKLYRVATNGQLRLVRTVGGRRGLAAATFRSTGTGSYVVEMVSSGRLADLELNLSCGGGHCSPDRQPGELCGGIAAFRCAEGLYCAYAPEASCGAGDQGGSCAKAPEMCPQMYQPVCGCDDRTYSNACVAASNGMSIKGGGECPTPIAHEGESCGGFRRGPAPVCAEGLYCNYRPEDICGFADAPGTCADKPESCGEDPSPICGCDGETYENSCVAALKGVAVNHRGDCEERAPN